MSDYHMRRFIYPPRWEPTTPARTKEGYVLYDWQYSTPDRVPVCWGKLPWMPWAQGG